MWFISSVQLISEIRHDVYCNLNEKYVAFKIEPKQNSDKLIFVKSTVLLCLTEPEASY